VQDARHDRASAFPGFNSPVGILAVCAYRVLGEATLYNVFQFPGWNSGRLCAMLAVPPFAANRFQFPGWNSGRLCCPHFGRVG